MESETPQPLASGRFAGPTAFAQLVRDALDCAARDGWKQIVLSDATFEDWPLRERSVVESLQAWSASGRNLVMLAIRYDEVIRHHPRFVAWRKTWGHIIDCRVCHVGAPADFPSALWSREWYLQRIDATRSTGVCGIERARSVALKEVLDEKIRNSSPGFPTSTLGL